MRHYISKVKKFHRAFGIPVRSYPKLPSPERVALRNKLLREEVRELEEAIESGDIFEIAKEFTDVLYVLIGTALEFGLYKYVDFMFDEVHKSNMSKLDENGKPLYREDGKVIKSDLYKPADMRKALDR